VDFSPPFARRDYRLRPLCENLEATIPFWGVKMKEANGFPFASCVFRFEFAQ
jgi:hypothetical protein